MGKIEKNNELMMLERLITDAGLYIVPEEKFEELSEVAADSFLDYPLFNWFANGTYDPVVPKLIIKTSLASMKNDAVIYADSQELNGFAICIPPGFAGSKTVPFLKNGGIKLLLHSGFGIIKKLLIYESFAMELKKKHTGHKDWYLYNLSVRKNAQGRGIAKKLMCPFLQLCSNEKMIAYLETNKESNILIYNRLGFELCETNQIPGSLVSHYSMKFVPKQ